MRKFFFHGAPGQDIKYSTGQTQIDYANKLLSKGLKEALEEQEVEIFYAADKNETKKDK